MHHVNQCMIIANKDGQLGIDEMDINGIIVYPNPTDNTLNIETHLSILYELRDMMGKLILTGDDNQLELGHI